MCPALCRWVGGDSASVGQTEKLKRSFLRGEVCVEELILTRRTPPGPRRTADQMWCALILMVLTTPKHVSDADGPRR